MTKPLSPRFKVGDHVLYRPRNLRGIVTNVINFGDHVDIAKQGHRYYVKISREIWSIRESDLLFQKSSNDFKPKPIACPFLLPSAEVEAAAEGEPICETPLTVLLASERKKGIPHG